jgi:hypothetical protein
MRVISNHNTLELVNNSSYISGTEIAEKSVSSSKGLNDSSTFLHFEEIGPVEITNEAKMAV